MSDLVRAGLLSGLLAAALSSVAAAQPMPGDTPRLFLDDGFGNQAPGPAGPFDNSAVFGASAGTAFSARLEYLAEGASNAVPWGLLISTEKTPFPAALPPPLFTMPPLVFIAPTPSLLDGSGTGSIPFSVPEGMLSGTLYFQALVHDVASAPMLKLSNGVALDIVPGRFNVRFSVGASIPPTAGLQGLGTVDLDADTMAEIVPLGIQTPPPLSLDSELGVPAGFRFLPILPNVPDAPINPLARPVTTLTEAMQATLSISVFNVVDTSQFPPQGTIYVSRAGANPNQAANPWADRTATRTEVVTYTGKTPTSFTGCTRKVLGSTGNTTYPHLVGEMVLGDYTWATTAGAVARTRVSLDVRNGDLPHVVIPAFTYNAGEDEGMVTLDLDLYRYEVAGGGAQGFMVLDRNTHTWRVLPGTEIATAGGARWDPMVHVTPDRRAFLATKRTFEGATFASSQDELWALRLDGLDWPASGSPVWKIEYQATPEPAAGVLSVKSRRIHMPFVRTVGPNSDNAVAFVGLTFKWGQTDTGNGTVANQGFEGFWVREDVLVSDVFNVPLVPPGSAKAAPASPRPLLTPTFPLLGTGESVLRFDPDVLLSADGRTLVMTAGASQTVEDVYAVRNVSITSGGAASYQLFNISGLNNTASDLASTGLIRSFAPGGDGYGQTASITADGSRVAWLMSFNVARDFLMTARTSGADYGQVKRIYADSTLKFKIPGEYVLDHTVRGLRMSDADTIYFCMGRQKYDDPLTLSNLANTNDMDIFRYKVSTDTLVRIVNSSGDATAFAKLGRMTVLATFLSPDRKFYYVVRGGTRCVANCGTGTPTTIPVVNVLAVATASGLAYDVTGHEIGLGSGLITDLFVPTAELQRPVETPASMEFVEGTGSQSNMLYFRAHLQSDAAATDEIFAFNMASPGIAFPVTSGSAPGSHVSNITPSPFGGSVAFARTQGTSILGADQHLFAVDLTTFLFERDITSAYSSFGTHFGRLMDGSVHFLPSDPITGAGTALVFSFGLTADPLTGVAQASVPVYYPLANLANPVAEPNPLLIPLVDIVGLGPSFRLYVPSAGLSAAAP